MMHGVLRLYDSTATPFYLQVIFSDGSLTAPEGRARPEETPVFDRGRGDTNTHYIMGPDTPIVEPLELSFAFKMQNSVANAAKLRNALSNPSLASPWQVGSNTWVTTKGDSTLTNGAASTFTDPAFEDTLKQCVNVEILWTRGAVAIGRKYTGVYFAPDQQSLAEAEDGVNVSVTGSIYGSIEVITSFTAGSAS
jgi:hypothetical protein